MTHFDYDQEWQLLSITDPAGHTTRWTYDAAGNRQTQTDANGHTYRWVYDSRNRVLAETNAVGQVTTFAYDAAGNRTNRVNGAGEVTFWNYDALNRVTVTGSGTLQYEYVYDTGGRRTAMRTRVNGSVTETTTYAYDLNDRLVCKADPTGYTLCYDYDPVGNRTNFAVAPTAGGDSILRVSYTYDNRNRVSTITGNGRTTTFTYDAVGRRTGATWPNNSTATYTYDAAHQLLSLDHKTSGNADIATFAYAYDLAGNRTSMTTLEGVNSYTYNANNWLTGVTYPDGRSQQFTYDPVGNRVSLLDSGIGFQPVQYTYDNANRLLSSVSATETNVYSYDNAGRLTAQTVNGEPRTYSYDFRSQMTALTDTNAATGNYEFDGDGNRISMIPVGTAGPAVRMVYDGPNVVLDLDATTLQPVSAYVHGLGIDQPIERIDIAGGRYVYHTDALGSVVAMTDANGNPVKAYTYEAFGKIRSETGELANRYTFTAREALGDSLGLMYYRWRVMDPNSGRFTSEDPLGFVDGPNPYSCVNNQPLVFADPLGLAGIPRLWPPNYRRLNMIACLGGAARIYRDELAQAQQELDNCLATCVCSALAQTCIANCQRTFNLSAAMAATNYARNSLTCMVPLPLPGQPPPVPSPMQH